MIATDFEIDEEGMTVPYPPLFDEVRKNHGFVDVRRRPDLASQISEASQSPALKDLLLELSQPQSNLFTLGCDLGTTFLSEESLPHTAGGYIQLANTAYSERTGEDYFRYVDAITKALEQSSDDHEWNIHFVLKWVVLTLDDFSGMVPSLWIWFHAFAYTEERALISRESLICELGQLLTNDRHLLLFDAPQDDAA